MKGMMKGKKQQKRSPFLGKETMKEERMENTKQPKFACGGKVKKGR